MDLTVVDSFTDRPFSGNPAAVAQVNDFPDESRMQAIAREMNLSETAFVVARPDGSHDLRWFSPTVEVDLCGHATLATAHVFGGAGRFHTRSGVLTCSRADDGWIEMDFPADPTTPDAPPPSLARALGLAPGTDPGRIVHAFARARADLLVELADAETVRALRPDSAAVAELGSRCVIVTAAGDRPGIDCVTRVFAPNAESPRTP